MKSFKIIDNTDEAKDKEGWLYGGAEYVISKEELDALLKGKCLSTEINAEYRIFVRLEETENE